MTKVCLLSDAKIETFLPKDKSYRVFDSNGLYLEILPNGSKLWRVQKNVDNKVIRHSLGKYPELDLKTARKQWEIFEANIDPGNTLEITTFGDLFVKWKVKHTVNYAPLTLIMLNSITKNHLIPQLGSVKLTLISPQLILKTVLWPIENLGHFNLAARVKNICGQVLRYGVALGVIERDFTQDLKGVLASGKVRHMPTITEPSKVGKLMKDIFFYYGEIHVVYALRILPYVFVRPNELREALWEEVNLEDKIWRIPAEKMKMKRPHLVPLADQVVTMLTKLKNFTGQGRFLFSKVKVKDHPISHTTLNRALNILGYSSDEIVPHGFRSMASTLLNEQGYSPDWIEKQLAHAPRGVRGIYNRSEYLPGRRQMMQDWADYLDKLRLEAK
jgi:integrase